MVEEFFIGDIVEVKSDTESDLSPGDQYDVVGMVVSSEDDYNLVLELQQIGQKGRFWRNAKYFNIVASNDYIQKFYLDDRVAGPNNIVYKVTGVRIDVDGIPYIEIDKEWDWRLAELFRQVEEIQSENEEDCSCCNHKPDDYEKKEMKDNNNDDNEVLELEVNLSNNCENEATTIQVSKDQLTQIVDELIVNIIEHGASSTVSVADLLYQFGIIELKINTSITY